MYKAHNSHLFKKTKKMTRVQVEERQSIVLWTNSRLTDYTSEWNINWTQSLLDPKYELQSWGRTFNWLCTEICFELQFRVPALSLSVFLTCPTALIVNKSQPTHKTYIVCLSNWSVLSFMCKASFVSSLFAVCTSNIIHNAALPVLRLKSKWNLIYLLLFELLQTV